jgi:hypothetical protein
LAAVAAVRGRPDAAARILGFVEAWRRQVDYLRSGLEEATFGILTSSLEAQLPSDVIERLCEEGAQFSLEQAVREESLPTP